jgi:hypothetical protein
LPQATNAAAGKGAVLIRAVTKGSGYKKGAVLKNIDDVGQAILSPADRTFL